MSLPKKLLIGNMPYQINMVKETSDGDNTQLYNVQDIDINALLSDELQRLSLLSKTLQIIDQLYGMDIGYQRSQALATVLNQVLQDHPELINFQENSTHAIGFAVQTRTSGGGVTRTSETSGTW